MCGTALQASQRRRLHFQLGDLLLIAVVIGVAFLWWTRGTSRDSAPAGGLMPAAQALVTITPTRTPTATAGPSPTPTETPTITPTPTPIIYTVVRGDTIEKIALTYGVSVQDLMIVNGLTSDLIRVDQKLLIPAGPLPRGPDGKPLPTPTPTQRSAIYLVQVRPGDTLESIAKRLGTSADAIVRANDWIENADTIIRPGDQLIVPVGTVTASLTPLSDERPTNTPVPTFTPTPGMHWPAPKLLAPPEDASFQGGFVLLQWLSVGMLWPDEVYVVHVIPEDNPGAEWVSVTTGTSFRVPEKWLAEQSELSERFRWTVQVARNIQALSGQGSGLREASASSPPRSFTWRPAANQS